MNNAFERAQFLYSQQRYEEAKRELPAAMAETPDWSRPVVLMALCLMYTNHPKEAIAEAERAVALNPMDDWAMCILGLCQNRAGQTKKALASVHQALALNPNAPSYYSLLAEIYAKQRDWRRSLEMAELGLHIDPEHSECLQFRSQALSFLGRMDEALDQAHGALHLDPDSEDGHTDLGWIYLRRGQREPALAEFKEALRIDPKSSRAQLGLRESLRAVFPPYRVTMAVNHWLTRLSPNVRIGAIFTAYVAVRGIAALAQTSPALTFVAVPLIAFFYIFIFFRRIMEPIATATLLFHPLGRIALGPEQRREMWFLIGYIACSPIFALLGVLTHGKTYIGAGWMLFTFVLVLLAWTIQSSPVSHRIAFWGTSIFCGLIGVLFGVAEIVTGGK